MTCLADVHLGSGSAGDFVDHACPAFGLNTILQVYKRGGGNRYTDAQGGEDLTY